MGGICIQPDLALDELSPADSAMLILPGGIAGMKAGTIWPSMLPACFLILAYLWQRFVALPLGLLVGGCLIPGAIRVILVNTLLQHITTGLNFMKMRRLSPITISSPRQGRLLWTLRIIFLSASIFIQRQCWKLGTGYSRQVVLSILAHL